MNLSVHTRPRGLGRYIRYTPELIHSNIDRFICHPRGFPIACRRMTFWDRRRTADCRQPGSIGLCFDSDKYIKPGTLIEITIPLNGEEQKFTGKVVLVRNRGDGFEIGLWLSRPDDAGRLRIIEQICHIESYLRQKRHQDGPFISQERIAREWVTRFAASFPTLL